MKASTKSWWALFGLGVALTIAALAWISIEVLDLGKRENAALVEHRRQHAIRLALWRMDSWFGPQLSMEVARLPHEYEAYTPQDLAYTRVLNQIAPGEVLVPSPLLTFQSDIIRVHFQLDAANSWTSPEVPESNSLDLADASGYLDPTSLGERRAALDELRQLLSYRSLMDRLGGAEINFCQLFVPDAPSSNEALSAVGPSATTGSPGARAKDDANLNLKERNWRVQVTQQAQIPEMAEKLVDLGKDSTGDSTHSRQRETRSSPLVPLWVDRPGRKPHLLYVRRVRTSRGEVLQGFLANWDQLRGSLRALIADLLPQASITPQQFTATNGTPPKGANANEDLDGRLLATIPALLTPGPMTQIAASGWSSGETTLLVGWLVALTALGVVGLGLRSSIRFGEQRSRFASTVTHELRTPLTTFRLYSEMLAAGMVPVERRQEYLETLEKESNRLNTLVENVLSYSRLEEGSAGLRKQSLSALDLLERARPILERRASTAGVTLSMTSVGLENLELWIDPEAVTQILFNLVDNACKYGACKYGRAAGPSSLGSAAPIEVLGDVERGRVRFRVRDQGPGVGPGSRRAIFRAFDRGGLDATDPNPGVGLGLALARGLARDLGGDLILESSSHQLGATFCLWLPSAP